MTAAAAKKEVTIGGAVGVPPAGAVALRSLTMRNVLSFGAEATVELGALNVLIGANGCGKSNLMDVVALLKAAATTDLSDEFRGGAEDWVWRGASDTAKTMGVVSCWVKEDAAVTHSMKIRADEGTYFILRDEDILRKKFGVSIWRDIRIQREDAFTIRVGDRDGERFSILNPVTPIHPIDSAPPPRLDEFYRRELSDTVKDAQVYRSRQVGRMGELNPLHRPSRTDLPIDRLSETLDNFALVLNRVRLERENDIVKALREINDNARGLDVKIGNNRAEVVLKEKGGNIPAHRMSDGMLNWLFLLTVLLDPKPPALVCIDEPETGLHMDALPALAELLRDASSRMQLIVATHSDMLADFFTDIPESVVVCDKVDGVTQMRRLCAKDLEGEEGLGDAWISGAVGGKRW